MDALLVFADWDFYPGGGWNDYVGTIPQTDPKDIDAIDPLRGCRSFRRRRGR